MTLRVGVISAWDMDDEYAWSGVCYHAVRALESEVEVMRFQIPEIEDSLVDRLLAKLCGKFRRTYLARHSIATAYKRSSRVEKMVKPYRLDAVISLAASTETLKLPSNYKLVQVTDSSFQAMVNGYFEGKKISKLTMVQGRIIDVLSARKSNKFSLASEWSSEIIKSDLKVSADQVLVNPFGPGTVPKTTRKKYPSEPLKVLFIGSDWERKGGAQVIESIEEARKTRPIELTVIGATDRVLPAWVNSVPKMKREELSKVYLNHDILIELSSASAGGVVVTDAVAHGLAVIATDIGGIPTIVENNGWLVSFDNRVEETTQLLKTISLHEIFISQEHSKADYCNRLNWENWAKRLLNMVELSVHSTRAQQKDCPQ